LVGVFVIATVAVPELSGALGDGVPSAADSVVSAVPESFAVVAPVPIQTTTTTAPPLAPVAARVPASPPADPRAPEPLVVLGTIEIPRLGLNLPLHQGISLRTIDHGPSHWPGTALPGEIGNAVVAGHRVTNGAPFRDIDQLQPGDPVVFAVGGRRSTYRVTGHEVVTPDAMRIVDQTPTATATLFACHPPGSARYRYVVNLALESVS
jgi:sortase A